MAYDAKCYQNTTPCSGCDRLGSVICLGCGLQGCRNICSILRRGQGAAEDQFFDKKYVCRMCADYFGFMMKAMDRTWCNYKKCNVRLNVTVLCRHTTKSILGHPVRSKYCWFHSVSESVCFQCHTDNTVQTYSAVYHARFRFPTCLKNTIASYIFDKQFIKMQTRPAGS